MPTTRQGRRPTKRSIAAIVLVLVGVAIGMFVIASALAKLGIFQTVVLTAGYLVGAIFGQAKDVANRKTFSGDLWQDLQDFFSKHGQMKTEQLSSFGPWNGEGC